MPDTPKHIIDQLAALGQESRFRVFRRLMKAGPDGIPAGQLASELDILPNTLSTHLGILSRTGLVSSRRDGRTLYYSADIESVSGMVEGIVADCCNGNPDLCKSLQTSKVLQCG